MGVCMCKGPSWMPLYWMNMEPETPSRLGGQYDWGYAQYKGSLVSRYGMDIKALGHAGAPAGQRDWGHTQSMVLINAVDAHGGRDSIAPVGGPA